MNPRDNGNENFVMVFPEELCEKAVLAVKAKALQPRDLAVLVALLGNVNWRSGRAQITPSGLAQQLGILDSNCRASISRLRKQLLISRVLNRGSGDNYFLINPYLASVGGPSRRGHLWQQFQESLE
jgi:Tfp pilus assembly protein PilX